MLAKISFIILVIHLTIGHTNLYQKCSDAPPDTCGPNAECIDKIENFFRPKSSHEGAYCRCNFDAFGTPPNCELYCKDGCKKGEYCDYDEKMCKAGCRFHTDCHDNEYCKTENCDDGTKCEIGCRGDESCESGEYCDANNKCTIGCSFDEACAADEYCDRSDHDCKKGCRSNISCGSDEYCDIYDIDCRKGCWRDEQCRIDEFCDIGAHNCRKGCRDDDSCEIGKICDLQRKKCRIGCRKLPDDCPENYVCDSLSNKCVEDIQLTSNCTDDRISFGAPHQQSSNKPTDKSEISLATVIVLAMG